MWARPDSGVTLPAHTGELLTFADLFAPVNLLDGAQLPEAPRACLLVFFPFAFSPICQSEIQELSAHADMLQDAGIRPVAVSCDPKFSLRAWADAHDLRVPLLSDFWPHGELSREFGVFDDRQGMSIRGTFLLTAAGERLLDQINPAGEGRDFSAAGLEQWVDAADILA